MAAPGNTTFHIVMYPWFAVGHITPYLHVANKLAEKGHKIYFLIPPKTKSKFEQFNLHPDLITFIPITLPHVEGLPQGVETTADVPAPLRTHIMTAMDRTEVDVELLLGDLKPNFVFFDLAYWIPRVARRFGIKSIYFSVINASAIAYLVCHTGLYNNLTVADRCQITGKGLPDYLIKRSTYEIRQFDAACTMEFGSNVRFFNRIYIGHAECDALGFKTCREIEQPFIEYLEAYLSKPILPTGLVMPGRTNSILEAQWAEWLEGFKTGTVIYCALGTECILTKNQFQELLLGLELTRMPFLAALKPPTEVESIEAAFPEGFEKRVQGRGVVYGGWVQQPLILDHPSIGCFITHCGPGSLTEALLSKCRLVFLPSVADQIINARVMARTLKVGTEVEKGEEDGLFTKESVYKAVMSVAEENSEVGKEISGNHARLRELLRNKDLQDSHFDTFNRQLYQLLED